MPYDSDARRRALASSSFGFSDSGSGGTDDWQQQQINQLDWEAKQAIGLGLVPSSAYEEIKAESTPNWIQKYVLGLWGEDAQKTGGVLETIGDVLNTMTGSYFTGGLMKTAIDERTDPDRTSSLEILSDPRKILDHPEMMTMPGQLWHNARFLGSWWNNYHNAHSVTRVAEDKDLWDSMGDLGFYRPVFPMRKIGTMPGLGTPIVVPDVITPGVGSMASAALSAGEALGIVPDGADTLGGMFREGQQPVEAASTLAQTMLTGTDGSEISQEVKRSISGALLGNDQTGYALTPTENFIGGFALDVAMDPTTYLTFGAAPGMRAAVALDKSGTAFQMGGRTVKLATTPRRGKVTFNKKGTHFFHMAVSDLVDGWKTKGLGMDKGVPLMNTEVDGVEAMSDVMDTLGRNFDKYRDVAAQQAEVVTLTRFKNALRPFVQDPAEPLTMLAERLRTIPETPPSVRQILSLAAKQRDEVLKMQPEDLFNETTDGLRRELSLYSPEFITDMQQKLVQLPKIGKTAKWFFDTFDKTWDMPADAVELANYARRKVQLDMEQSVQRYTEAFQYLEESERKAVSHIVEGRWLQKNGYPSPVPMEYNERIEAAANFVEREMDEIFLEESQAGFAINSVEDYISHILTLHPNMRENWTNFLRKGGEISPTNSNRFAQNRLIATLREIEEGFGEGIVQTDAYKILALRKQASLEMREYDKFYSWVANKHGRPTAILTMMARGDAGPLLRAMAMRNSVGVDEIIPTTQAYHHQSSTLKKAGYRENDFDHNAELLRYHALPFTNEPGGRFSTEGIQLAEKLGVQSDGILHGRVKDRSTEVPGLGRHQTLDKAPMPAKIKWSTKVKLRAKGPEAALSQKVKTEFDNYQVLRMLKDPQHIGWRKVLYPGGHERLDLSVKGLEDFVYHVDQYLRNNLNSSLMGMVPDLEDRLVRMVTRQTGGAPDEAMLKAIETSVKKANKHVEVRELIPSLPLLQVEHAKRSRQLAGDITSDLKPSRADVHQMHLLAHELGFDSKLLRDFTSIVIGKPMVDNAEEMGQIISALGYWHRKEFDKYRLQEGLPDFYKIGGQNMVKFTMHLHPKLEGNALLPELLDQDLGVKAVDADFAVEVEDPIASMDSLEWADNSAGSSRVPVGPPRGTRFMKVYREGQREIESMLTGLHNKLAPIRDMTFPSRRKKKGAPSVEKTPEPQSPGAIKDFQEEALGVADDEFPVPDTAKVGEWERHSQTLTRIIDAPEMKVASDLREKYQASKVKYEKVKAKWHEVLKKRRNPDGSLSSPSTESNMRAKQLKKALAEMEAAKALYDGPVSGNPVWMKPTKGNEKNISYRKLLSEKEKLIRIRHRMAKTRQSLVREYKVYDAAVKKAPTGRDAVKKSGLTTDSGAGEMVFQPPEYLTRAREMIKPDEEYMKTIEALSPDASPQEKARQLADLKEKDLPRLLAARKKSTQRDPVPGIIDGQRAAKVSANAVEMYLPESIARLATDLQKKDIPEGAKQWAKTMLHGFDQLQSLYKTNLMLPWGAYWNRNLMSNSLLLYTGAGLRFLQPDVMSDFFKVWYYSLGRYSDIPTVMGISPSDARWGELGKMTLSTKTSLGREENVAEIVDIMRASGTMTGIVDAESINAMGLAMMPDWAKQVTGGAIGGMAGAAVGATAGAINESLAPEYASDPIFEGMTFLGALAGATLGGRKLKTSGVPVRSGRAVTAMLQSSFRPLLRNGEMATEAPLRVLLYMETLKRTGSHLEAKNMVFRQMNDWNNLGVTERRYLRRLFPFYTWTKFATQQTFRSILEQPNRVNNIFRTFEEWNRAHDYDPEDVPDWYHEKLFLMGQAAKDDKSQVAATTLYSGFGATYEDTADLMSFISKDQNLTDLTRKLMARGPLGLGAVGDALMDRDSFTGRQITTDANERSMFAKGESWESAPIWLRKAVGYREATANSRAVVDPRVAWVLGKVPPSRFISYIRDIREMDENQRKRIDFKSLSRSLLGASVYKVDPATQKYFVNKARIDAMAELLMSAGAINPTVTYSDVNKTDQTPQGGARRGRSRGGGVRDSY